MDATPPSMAFEPRQTRSRRLCRAPLLAVQHSAESWLERERDQLPLWVPVCLGVGISAWFTLPSPGWWIGFVVAMLVVAAISFAMEEGGRSRAALQSLGLLAACGVLLIWSKALMFGEPPIRYPVMAEFHAVVSAVEQFPARRNEQIGRAHV